MHVETQSRGTFGFAARGLSRRLALTAAALSVLAACEPERTVLEPEGSFSRSAGPRQGTFYGAAVRLGDGIARSYFTLQGGATVEVGVALSESALSGLPSGSGHSDGTHTHYNEYLLEMHPRNPTPYQFVELNWNPQGHEPPGIYDLPHFDFHFYTISLAERNAIDPSDPLWTQKANNVPAAEYIPTNYVPAGPPGVAPVEIAVPRMGVHWMDVTSPELSGATFTETFIYGSWDGEMIFVEPMVTKAFLEAKPSSSRTLPTAQKGYNPGGYRIYWNERTREYRVALTGLPAEQ